MLNLVYFSDHLNLEYITLTSPSCSTFTSDIQDIQPYSELGACPSICSSSPLSRTLNCEDAHPPVGAHHLAVIYTVRVTTFCWQFHILYMYFKLSSSHFPSSDTLNNVWQYRWLLETKIPTYGFKIITNIQIITS